MIGRPALSPDGTCWVALISPDLEADEYRGSIHRITPEGERRLFTRGARDTAPVLSPDAQTLVFLRSEHGKPSQLWTIPTAGGEPRQLTWHPLGAGAPVFSADGKQLLYVARVPEAGRYGTDDKVGSEAEPPRRITGFRYRADNVGFIGDRPNQGFVLDLAGAGTEVENSPGSNIRQLTAEPAGVSEAIFGPAGTVLYVREAAPDSSYSQLVQVSDSELTDPGAASVVAAPDGTISHPVLDDETVYYVGVMGDEDDMLGLNPGLFCTRLGDGDTRRLTDPETVAIDSEAGDPIIRDANILAGVANRGAIELRAIPKTAENAVLTTLSIVMGGERVLRTAVATDRAAAAVLAGVGTTGELVTLPITADGLPDGVENSLTDVAEPLRTNGILPQIEISGTSPDGYPVHGWLVLPAGDGPHPVLLDVHGGPHAAYGWGFFDEAQVYAGAGYAVVLPNPRGSAGYGQEHGRTILHRLGTVDADDVLALLDAALMRDDLDESRVGVMGGSYGGFMTAWLASQAPGRFVAGISERSVNAWDSFAGSSDIGWRFAGMLVGADRDAQLQQSPLAHADDICIPLLIMHSEHDWRCPVEQAQRLFVSLKQRGAEVEMLLFPAEGHELSRSGRPRHRQQRFEAILEWWGRYLPIAGS